MTRDYAAAHPLARRHMPGGFDISLDRYTQNGAVRLPEDRGPAHPLTGFDPTYRNIVDYIVRITHRIWETDTREVVYIADCYAPRARVFDDFGLQVGSAKIIDDTHHTTGAFPDIVLDAQEVIWAGDDDIGFHTSHRLRIMGTNTGDSRFGPATGARIDLPCIANCVVLSNDIFLEHVVYNTTAMLKQLGIDPWKEAARMVANPPAGWPRSADVWDGLRSAAAPVRPLSLEQPVSGFDPDAFARRVHGSLWNGDGAEITSYAADLSFEGTSGRASQSRAAYGAYVRDLRRAFPDLALSVDEVYWMGNDAEGWRISTRWSAEGTHLGDGPFGPASGAGCQVWGITQWQVHEGQISHEWQLFNEFDLMMQITAARTKTQEQP